MQAFTASFLSYYLIKIVPFWGLCLIGTTLIYSVPLIYISNREFIDEHISSANHVLSEQANQVKDIASQHTSKATETIKTYTHDYTTKAQEMIGSARGRSASPEATVKSDDFPRAPNKDPILNGAAAEPQLAS
jgi:hypothetical protein